MADRSVFQFAFTADNRSAIKAMKAIDEQSNQTKKGVTEDSDEESMSMDKLRDRTEMLRGAFASLAGMVGIGGVAFGLKDMVDQGEDLQTSLSKLDAALRATGLEAGGTGAHLQAVAESMSSKGGFSTEQNLAALTQFVGVTRSAAQAQKYLGEATDLARFKNISLASATQLVTRALSGSTRGLQSTMGPILQVHSATVALSVAHQQEIARLQDEAQMMGKMGQIWLRQQEVNDHLTASQTAAAQVEDKRSMGLQALAEVQKIVAGQTTAYSHTVQGQMNDMRQSLDNLSANLGKSLLPAFDKVVGAAAAVAGWFEKNKAVALTLAGAVTTLATAWGAMKIAKELKAMWLAYGQAMNLVTAEGELDMAALGMAVKAFVATTLIGVLFITLAEMILHWKQVKQVAVDVWHALETAAQDTWGWIKNHWKILVDVLLAPVEPLAQIITHLKLIKQLAGDVIHAVSSVIGGVGHFISHPFGLHFAQGGVVPRYMASGGPVGTDTVPAWLTPGEGVVTTQGMSALGAGGLSALNNGYSNTPAGGATQTFQPYVLQLDNRVLLRGVIRQVLNDAARGPTSFAGGALVTGSTGLPV